MAVEVFANNATAVVTSGGTAAPSPGTSETWTLSSSTLPAVSSSATPPTQCYLVDPSAVSEKMLVTNISGTSATVTRGADGTTPVVHTSGFTVQQVLTRASLNGFSQSKAAFASILDYGADPSGNTDSTSAITAAIAAVTPADGVFDVAGTVLVPSGQYLTGPIVLPQRVGLLGTGYGSTLVLSASAPANCTMVSNSQDAGAAGNGAQMCFVSNLRLDGNNSHRAGNWDSAIVFTNTYHPTWPYEYADARHVISGVNIQYFTGDGIVVDDSTISDCNIWSVGGFGFVTASDANFANCGAGGCGLDGFVVPGSSQLTNCKSWYSGSALTSGQYSGQNATALSVTAPNNYWGSGSLTYTLAAGYGNGFLLAQPAAGGPTQGGNFGTLSGCYAQDNARAGFYIDQSYANLSGCTADSNGNNGTSDGTSTGAPVGSFAGFDVTSAGSNIDGISFNRSSNLNQQAAGLHVYSGFTGGNIHLGFGGSLNDGSNMPPLMAGDVPQGVDLRMYHMSTFTGSSQGGGYFADASFATGSYAVDPFWATTWDLTLSGNITLGNPAMKGTNTTGTFLYQGMKLRYIIRQGSTAFTVSWGAAFAVRSAPAVTANSVSILDFVYDGTTWQQVVSGISGGGGNVVQLVPSGDTTGATDAASINAAVAALPAFGGKIVLAPGTWYIECGQVSINRSGAWIDATGCYINAVGAGDMIRMFDSSSYDSRAVYGGGLLGMPTIDGTSTTGNSCAVHLGDFVQAAVYAQVKNFTAGTTSKGVWLDNNYYWTEQLRGRIYTQHCTEGVRFDNSANLIAAGESTSQATGSFDRATLTVFVNNQGVGDGVVFDNGAIIDNGRLEIFGNFGGGASTLYSVLTLTGSNTVNGSSGIFSSFLNIGVEYGSGTVQARTITFGGSGNIISACTGIIDFSASAPFAASNNNFNFWFNGPVTGDEALVTKLNGAPYSDFIDSGFPAGWGGSIFFQMPAANGLVHVQIRVNATAGTALTPGTTIASGIPAWAVPGDNTFVPVDIGGIYASFRIAQDGTVSFNGPAITPTVQVFPYGQTVYTNS
jgi:hypothetical protein